ncbi:YkvA family protein [Cytobacillus purgationiresistens]|uniref:Uncharacterized membrane protein YkvA (DUF1232 family) n=1 Tax=Cytobacillus purgationiresistens TaxID=863449 RepID=A0ABU0ACU8_9BACI|nr:DUF1232 domain-containing protein [Cytobacillus purgationiresistens]MDQ0269081.1 uncharacterized membrane protein YkvA (DUF1232 family) [Cytobacillus purgationiresistens]
MKKFFKRIKFVFTFWRFIPFLIDYLFAKELSIWKKVLPLAISIVYIVIPIDLIPDFLFFFGYTDDILFTTFLLQTMVKYAPDRLKEKYELLMK